jgi:hypothetical protein
LLVTRHAVRQSASTARFLLTTLLLSGGCMLTLTF